ncbi:MAG: hypothetical protein AAFZ18_25205 [Myxococcota bacterium]
MTQTQIHSEELTLTINGSKLAVGERPELAALEPALRSIALSDSPIVVRSLPDDHEHFLARLHALSRRSDLPVHRCSSAREAQRLFAGVARDIEETDTLGTWALYDVHAWERGAQEKLSSLLEHLDLARLHGRLRHERIPRVVMLADLGSKEKVLPALDRRISYFTMIAAPHEQTEK